MYTWFAASLRFCFSEAKIRQKGQMMVAEATVEDRGDRARQ